MVKRFISKNFAKYAGVGIFATVLSTTWLMLTVEHMGWPVILMNPMIMAIIFILKFILYDKVGMLSKDA